jgi:hypothetical protein
MIVQGDVSSNQFASINISTEHGPGLIVDGGRTEEVPPQKNQSAITKALLAGVATAGIAKLLGWN